MHSHRKALRWRSGKNKAERYRRIKRGLAYYNFEPLIDNSSTTLSSKNESEDSQPLLHRNQGTNIYLYEWRGGSIEDIQDKSKKLFKYPKLFKSSTRLVDCLSTSQKPKVLYVFSLSLTYNHTQIYRTHIFPLI